MLGERLTDGINGSIGPAEEIFSIDFRKAKTKFCSSLYYNGDNSYLFVNKKDIYKVNNHNKNVNFQHSSV